MADPQMIAQMMQVSWLGVWSSPLMTLALFLSAESTLPADDAADDEQPSGHGAGQLPPPLPPPLSFSLPPSLPLSILSSPVAIISLSLSLSFQMLRNHPLFANNPQVGEMVSVW